MRSQGLLRASCLLEVVAIKKRQPCPFGLNKAVTAACRESPARARSCPRLKVRISSVSAPNQRLSRMLDNADWRARPHPAGEPRAVTHTDKQIGLANRSGCVYPTAVGPSIPIIADTLKRRRETLGAASDASHQGCLASRMPWHTAHATLLCGVHRCCGAKKISTLGLKSAVLR